ncbi:MAG: TonB C-terminal domain-containing protein [Nitrospinae bacterium]|nr:TonB C-terminal domain-containing protein [Nitrospinota bacterium]
MKPEFASSSDFNQMLVVSVFLHLFLIVVLMYLPKPKAPARMIVASFNVRMVEVPSGKSSGAQTPVREKEIAPPKQESAPAPEAKPAAPPPPPKPAEKKIAEPPVARQPEIASKIVKELEGLSGKSKKPGMVEELDRLAQLKPPVAPQRQAKKAPPLKETFRELDELKARKAEAKKPFLPAPPKVEESLGGFDSLKMKELAPPAARTPEKPAPKKENVDVQELELQALVNKKAPAEKEKTGKTAAELLKELERTAELQAVKPALPAPEKKKSAREIDISISSTQKSSEEFSSQLRKLEIPAGEKMPVAREEGKTPQGVQNQAAVSQAKPGPLAADILSLYVGTIREKVLSNWKSPLGAEHNEVVVSFFIFPQGNIGKPFADNSSGEDQLDTLAIRAILDSEPFPKFPAELKEPNLHITIRFKYVYQQ